MNIDCENIIEHMNSSKDDYTSYIHKILILQVIQKISCGMLIGGSKIDNSDIFFGVTNIRTIVKNDYSEFDGLLRQMVLKKPFMSQEMIYINENGERNLCTVSAYIKEFLRILEIENKKCYRCSKLKTPVELVSDKLIMFLDGLHTSNLTRKIDDPKCIILVNDTVVLDVVFHNYFQKSLLEDVMCEKFSSSSSESIKSTFTVSGYLKEPPAVFEIIFQRGKV